MTSAPDIQPTRLLIAAMGGEGGGVLAGWLTAAAMDAGLWVQRTSVPGVAQRTGATTYYLEFLSKTGGAKPVMALHPAPGRVDVLVATELLEAVRMVNAGFVTPDKTRLIASSHRTFTVDEKSAMEDGRLDIDPMIATCKAFSADALIRDFTEIAKDAGAHLNSVVMGVIAGAEALPIPIEACRRAIQSGKRASEANMRGFEAGLALVVETEPVPDLTRNSAVSPATTPRPNLPASEETSFLPDESAGLAAEGVRRLTEYQDAAYANSYLDHLRRIAAHPAATPILLAIINNRLLI